MSFQTRHESSVGSSSQRFDRSSLDRRHRQFTTASEKTVEHRRNQSESHINGHGFSDGSLSNRNSAAMSASGGGGAAAAAAAAADSRRYSWRIDENEVGFEGDSSGRGYYWEGSYGGGEVDRCRSSSMRFSSDVVAVTKTKQQQQWQPAIGGCASFKIPSGGGAAAAAEREYSGVGGAVARCYSDISGTKWGDSEEKRRSAMATYSNRGGGGAAADLSWATNYKAAAAAAAADNSFSSTAAAAAPSWGLRIDPEVKRKSRIVSYKAIAMEGKMKASVRRGLRWIKGKYLDTFHGVDRN